MLIPIRYKGFYDVPSIFLVQHDGKTFLFERPFFAEKEDDASYYQVYTMPELRDDELPTDWTTLRAEAIGTVGIVDVSKVQFDPTRKQAVDDGVFALINPM